MTTRSTRTARPPAGTAGGSLGGSYPDPSIGCPPVAGHSLWDEFVRPPGGGEWGDLRWILNAVGGAAPTAAVVTPTAATEVGIQRLSTGGAPIAIDEGVCGGWSIAGGFPLYRTPRVGSAWTCKVRLQDVTNVRVFSGLLAAYTSWWIGGSQGIGFRATNGGAAANWVGVCRDGAGETLIDMGVDASGKWRLMRWRHELTATGSVIVFERAGGSTQEANHGPWIEWVEAGRCTTNIPAVPLTYCPLAVVTRTANVAKAADIDFCGLGGAVIRAT